MSYQGWKNYATWNVALWIGNDESLYNLALESSNYEAFKASIRELGENTAIAFKTPDNVAWGDTSLDLEALDAFIEELKG